MNSNTGDRAIPRPRSAVLVASIVVGATLLLIGWNAWPVIRPARQVAVVQAVFDRTTSTEPLSQGQNSREVPTVQAPGWLEAEPFYIACSALADGIVESIEVLEGDFVEQGQVVARLVAEDAQIRLRRAEAELAKAKSTLGVSLADLEAAERAWAEPVKLQRAVETGRAAVAESEAEIAQLPLLIESARATLIWLEEEADRVARSTKQGATNELEYIAAEQRAAAQRAEVGALEARGPILSARSEQRSAELRAAQRDLELRIEDRRRLDTAIAMVAFADSVIARTSALRDEAALEHERMVIRAPISGYVQRRLKVPGDKVVRMMDSPHSAHLVYIYDPDRIQVRVDVPLADAAHISVGQICEVVVEVLPDRVFQGVVLRATHQADLQKNTLQFKVKVQNPDPALRPEMLTRVKFLPPRGDGVSESDTQSNRKTRVLIPADALDDDGVSARVWIVTNRRNGRGVLSARPVAVIERSGSWLTIVGDIQPGALIAVGVTEPQEGETVVVGSQTNEGSPS